jgi:dsDNA-specific endonuclease/ATPase MutS2
LYAETIRRIILLNKQEYNIHKQGKCNVSYHIDSSKKGIKYSNVELLLIHKILVVTIAFNRAIHMTARGRDEKKTEAPLFHWRMTNNEINQHFATMVIQR